MIYELLFNQINKEIIVMMNASQLYHLNHSNIDYIAKYIFKFIS